MGSIHLEQKGFFCFLLLWTCAGGKIVLLFHIYFSEHHYKLQTLPSFLGVMLGTSLGQVNFQRWWGIEITQLPSLEDFRLFELGLSPTCGKEYHC